MKIWNVISEQKKTKNEHSWPHHINVLKTYFTEYSTNWSNVWFYNAVKKKNNNNNKIKKNTVKNMYGTSSVDWCLKGGEWFNK